MHIFFKKHISLTTDARFALRLSFFNFFLLYAFLLCVFVLNEQHLGSDPVKPHQGALKHIHTLPKEADFQFKQVAPTQLVSM